MLLLLLFFCFFAFGFCLETVEGDDDDWKVIEGGRTLLRAGLLVVADGLKAGSTTR